MRPRGAGVVERAADRHRRQHHPQEGAAGIPHEDPGGGPVVDQKSGDRTRQDQQASADKPPRLARGGQHHEGKDRRRDEPDPRRQGIHVVEEVDRVDEQHNPENCEKRPDPGSETNSVAWTPLETMIAATRNCTTSRGGHGSPTPSSRSPIATRIAPAATIRHI